MFIGSAPASMGGGITTGTLSVLVMALWSLGRGFDRVRAGQRAISMGMVWRAVAVLITSLAVVMVATWLLLLTQDLDLSPALFEVVFVFHNRPLRTTDTWPAGQLSCSGRLAPLRSSRTAEGGCGNLVKYREEVVLVG
jgi:trk system potassium uptake protein TrkH